MELTPGDIIKLETDAQWSTYEDAFISSNFTTTLWDRRGDRLSLEHRYKKNMPGLDQVGLKSAYARLLIAVTEALSATIEYEADLKENNHILTSIGALYKAQCWSFRLTFTREDNDDRYDFMIGFRGLGEIESDL
jgi:lipopolysaccharide assembly outer membrane protein LptD (OstA)